MNGIELQLPNVLKDKSHAIVIPASIAISASIVMSYIIKSSIRSKKIEMSK